MGRGLAGGGKGGLKELQLLGSYLEERVCHAGLPGEQRGLTWEGGPNWEAREEQRKRLSWKGLKPAACDSLGLRP